MAITVDPIGYFHTASIAPYEVPRQSNLNPYNEGIIQLNKGFQFEQALEGLQGFDRIWVVFRFHRVDRWKPKVLPPRGGKKQGVFATRSPHRPNFIGFSCVELKEIKGLKLFVINHDLIDGTPILDIKPYLNYADCFSCERQGWLDELPLIPDISFEWTQFAKNQIEYLAKEWNCQLKHSIEHRLLQSPLPYPNNRVMQLKKGYYRLAYKTWRIFYYWKEGKITITHLKSGYDEERLIENKISQWNDVPIHQAFIKKFDSRDGKE